MSTAEITGDSRMKLYWPTIEDFRVSVRNTLKPFENGPMGTDVKNAINDIDSAWESYEVMSVTFTTLLERANEFLLDEQLAHFIVSMKKNRLTSSEPVINRPVSETMLTNVLREVEEDYIVPTFS